jgi:hypothetical protein
MQLFQPIPGSGASHALTAASSNTTLGTAANLSAATNVDVFNAGPNVAYVRLAQNGTAAATAADYPIPVNGRKVFELGANTNIAGISPAGTATLITTLGNGAF